MNTSQAITTGTTVPQAVGAAAGSPMFDNVQRVLEQERFALATVCEHLEAQHNAIESACQLLSKQGSGGARRVVVSGVGKAGLIGRKVAATLSSTGTPAAFMHPVEGLHGDVGFVHANDVALLFSYSGETVELIRLASQLVAIGCRIIAVTSEHRTSLAELAAVTVAIGKVEEACYLGLAPSSSTTVMLALGDALALAVARHNGFGDEDFARNHPAGSLGLKFRRVQEVMRRGDRLVVAPPEASVREVVKMVTASRTGAAVIAGGDNSLVGIFTDGDLRRALQEGGDVLERKVLPFASHPCHSIAADATLAAAMNLFSQTRTEDLPVVQGPDQQVVGLLCLKDVRVF